ncbi:Maf family nucleotide pyrophosphatase [Oxalobacter aliiformigenes]|uniref:Maf family protein n=1 Tax=Oxalobacter aliiformigenes TaxID=2946593 RepID=UPI0022AF6E06|nr:Maf family protein [Oxalobacter aliiformigenes]MCZ4064057.1 Maf family nucleotide pyrophosphatase [Oxalobacter aliiformigenes]WAV99434.1 Maf family nucleotide pyrophosphatase [Oxalobacter aliiformigenes]
MHSGENMIYLASKSPRRQKLLNQIAVRFTILDVPQQDPVHSDMVNEAVHSGENAYEYVSRIAREKAEYAWQFLVTQNMPEYPVLTADTTVVMEGKIIGKPADKSKAAEILRRLSGKTHQVLTSVAVRNKEHLFQTVQTSDVTFALLTSRHINAYVDTGEPFDKAGGYGIQGLAGKFITHITGSYSGIMGLPLYETTVLLRKAGISIP